MFWLLQKWNVTDTKYEKHWTLTIIFNPVENKKWNNSLSILLEISENIYVCLNSYSIRSVYLEATPYTR